MKAEKRWREWFSKYQRSFPDLALTRRKLQQLPDDRDKQKRKLIADANTAIKNEAARKSSDRPPGSYGPLWLELFGGSADPADSNHTLSEKTETITKEKPAVNYLHFGMREFAMTAVAYGVTCMTATFMAFKEPCQKQGNTGSCEAVQTEVPNPECGIAGCIVVGQAGGSGESRAGYFVISRRDGLFAENVRPGW